MKPEDIHLTDWKRILFGETPVSFTIEVLVRAIVMYVALVLILRVLGKRLSGQLTILEMGVMITLGAMVSAPMVMPDKGIVVAVILLLCAVLFLRGMGRMGVRSDRFELLAQGDAQLVVKDGMLDRKVLDQAALSRDVLFAGLRSKGLYHLGQVDRVYLEACGLYSIWKRTEAKPGLPIFPPADRGALGHCRPAEGCVACAYCGLVIGAATEKDRCARCGENEWMGAVTSREGGT